MPDGESATDKPAAEGTGEPEAGDSRQDETRPRESEVTRSDLGLGNSLSATARRQDRRWAAYVDKLSLHPVPFDEQWQTFEECFAERPPEDGPPIVWKPAIDQLEGSNLARFMRARGALTYSDLHRWSTSYRDAFWGAIIDHLGIAFALPPKSVLDTSDGVAQPTWLAGAELNCTDSCLPAGDAIAVVCGKEGSDALTSVTADELKSQVNRVANGLLGNGFVAGDAIAIYMPMTLECVVAYLAIVRAGLVVVSIADSFSPAEVQRRLEITGAKAILTVDRFERGGKSIALYDKVKQAGPTRAIVIADDAASNDADSNDAVALRDGDLAWSSLRDSSDYFEARTAPPDATINVLFSSGTTGDPKAIPWTHLTPIKCAMDGHLHHDIRTGDVVAWPTNIGWMMGPWLIFASLINGATIALYEGAPNSAGFTKFVSDARVTMLGVVPALVRAWRQAESVGFAAWDRVRVFSSTGEPSNRRDYLWLMSRTGYRAPVIEYLGGTEIGGGHITGTVVQPASPATFTTPALGLDFVLLDENHAPAADGTLGELYLIPPSIGLSQKLLNREHDTIYFRDCPKGPNGEVLRRHGDEMVALGHGFYRAGGRADDTMNLSGIKISSLELERVIDGHDAVYESAAVAVQPGGEGADQLVVFAVLDAESPSDDLRKEIQLRIASDLNPLFKLHDLVTVESLPRTASNKLMRRTLRAQYVTEQPTPSPAAAQASHAPSTTPITPPVNPPEKPTKGRKHRRHRR